MSETTEPPTKKAKMADTTSLEKFIENMKNSKKNLKAILSDEFAKPTHLTQFAQVYVGAVNNIQDLSKIITTLNEKMPLKELQHLKRARKNEVILCSVQYLKMQTPKSIQEYLEENVNELKDAFKYFKVAGLPAMAPKLKKQHQEFTRVWSCNFHPNAYLEKMCGDQFFSIIEIIEHRRYMAIAFEVANYYLSKIKDNLLVTDVSESSVNATVVVDPTIKSIVAISYDNRQNHPTQHTAMLAIDNVAKTQNGGAWNTADKSGIDKELQIHIQKKFANVKFGARNYLTKEALEELKMNASESPYLCTGYYVYMIREPCVMCSMGLVHARANRVFFCFNNSLLGALSSKTKLHCVPSLNHHFEVFTDFL